MFHQLKYLSLHLNSCTLIFCYYLTDIHFTLCFIVLSMAVQFLILLCSAALGTQCVKKYKSVSIELWYSLVCR
jgi:hypothetical protein